MRRVIMREVPLRAYSMKELLDLYEVGRKTFSKWLEGIAPLLGRRYGKRFTILQIKIIFENFGWPQAEFTDNDC
jgi:hypothetical protein